MHLELAALEDLFEELGTFHKLVILGLASGWNGVSWHFLFLRTHVNVYKLSTFYQVLNLMDIHLHLKKYAININML